jgi:hypothetical protein
VTVNIDRDLEREIARMPEVREACAVKAREVAVEAERLGREVADSYKVVVSRSRGIVRVKASSGGINAAGWIEFGTGPPGPTAVHAPLRRGAEARGLKLRARQGGTPNAQD